MSWMHTVSAHAIGLDLTGLEIKAHRVTELSGNARSSSLPAWIYSIAIGS